ncbi:uncharacterized protein LOC131150212 [Malania oleifera]|uniref:uncharacterized protein LOC131150212 n=1 Tax=Malania oleifera TaxID=397392 RepID=UPI0025ADE05A|nr:uncharacterized protein LOC131150212 [Malania oleifera]
MPEKGVSWPLAYLWVPRPNHLLQWRLWVLTAVVFLGTLAVWSIDGCNVKRLIEARSFRREYATLKLNRSVTLTYTDRDLTQNTHNFTLHIHYVPVNNHTQNHPNVTHLIHRKNPENRSHSKPQLPTNNHKQPASSPVYRKPNLNLAQPQAPANLRWISAELEQNLTSNLLARWLAPGGVPCKDSRTLKIAIHGLDGRDSIELSAGEIHEFVFRALDDSGNPRCLGGDYFETDISGERWKSRPPVKDLGNGSYSFSLQVHPDFAGNYNFSVILLFRHFEGLKFSPERFAFDKELRRLSIKFYSKKKAQLPELRTCTKSDFTRDVWSGRWTRLAKNDDCQIGDDGRYRCLRPDFACRNQWCNGSLALLESNGWVYSSHCSFKIFTGDSAWNCLKNRWIFFWGDSNHVDTIRNMLNFILDLPNIPSVPRRFDMNFTNPKDPSQSVRITSIFNGHSNETKNYLGLHSLRDERFRNLLKQYFSENTIPDTMIMNSGLHDGVYWRNIRQFAQGAEYAAKFWAEVMESVRRRGQPVPEFIYRTTVATGGYARTLAFNPNKMEAFNWVFLEKLREAGLIAGVIDDFDLSYAWHFDNRCNDGVHYGRAPAKMRWRDGQIGHQYFVDLMLAHVLLNRLCVS